MKVPAVAYADPDLHRREIDDVFLTVPLLVALACEVREVGDYVAYEVAGRPIVVIRGDDGRIRTFLDICRHRGPRVTDEVCGTARRLTCPYHSWSYDTTGRLVGIPGRDSFGEIGEIGLTELPTTVRSGAVFAVLRPQAGADLEESIDGWLDGLADSLALLRLDEFHPYRVPTFLDSPNWKLAADGYLDGYHIGYLHRNTIGTRAITNRNTYDLFGPHVRIGFAGTPLAALTEDEVAALPGEPDERLREVMSLVHYVFPNVSISGGHGDTLMMSRLLPGPTPDRSTTLQFQFYRQPIEGDLVEVAEEKRRTYESVVRDEDCATIFQIGSALDAVGDGHFLFGRNELGNQHLHRTVAHLTGDT
jgi:phenylpropionate dioxygenase-like ring-hydroxylating dioxygenase large terminal subunit